MTQYLIETEVRGIRYWLSIPNKDIVIHNHRWEGLINNATPFEDEEQVKRIIKRLKGDKEYKIIENK